jgi:hypothetical protein
MLSFMVVLGRSRGWVSVSRGCILGTHRLGAVPRVAAAVAAPRAIARAKVRDEPVEGAHHQSTRHPSRLVVPPAGSERTDRAAWFKDTEGNMIGMVQLPPGAEPGT